MEMYLNEKGATFLTILQNSKEPLCSVPIIKQSKGIIKRGSFFAIATQLEKLGYVTSERIDTGKPIIERLYKITEIGRNVLKTYNKIKELQK